MRTPGSRHGRRGALDTNDSGDIGRIADDEATPVKRRRRWKSPRVIAGAVVVATGVAFGVANLPAFASSPSPSPTSGATAPTWKTDSPSFATAPGSNPWQTAPAGGASAAPSGAPSASGSPGSSSSAQPSPMSIPANATASDGARVVAESRVDARTIDLTIASPALNALGGVRLLVPNGWTPTATKSYPVVYLLSGCCDQNDQDDWTKLTDVEQFTANTQAIIVMPTDGTAGNYSNWFNNGQGGPPEWSNFHIKEMMPILQQAYHVSSTDAVAAGLSLGGYGAVIYAEQNPGMFKAVAAYSAGLDTEFDNSQNSIESTQLTEGFNPLALWGDPTKNKDIWDAHNPDTPANLADLKGTKVFVACGNGNPGPLDPPTPTPTSILDYNWEDALHQVSEANTLPQDQEFVKNAKAAGVDVTTDFYGNGEHTWAYWQQELHKSWPFLAAALGISQ